MSHCRFTAGRILAVLLLVSAMASTAAAQSGILLAIDRDDEHSTTIETALSTRMNASFQETALQAAIASWREQFHINIVVDQESFSDADVSLDTPLTVEMTNVRFESLLDTVLEPLDLDFIVRADHLLITTSDSADTKTQIRVYPVQDLVLGVIGGRVVLDYDTLIDSITSTVATEKWEENGGNGSIAEMPATGALIVSQSRKVHKGVESFLAALREVRDAQGIEVLPPNLQPAGPENTSQPGQGLGGGFGPGGGVPAAPGQAPGTQTPSGGLFRVPDGDSN